MSRRVTLTLTEEQARAVASACDLAGRVAMGQWGDVIDHADAALTAEVSRCMRDTLCRLGSMSLGLAPGASLGIRSPRCRGAWRAHDVRDAIRHALWCADPGAPRGTVDAHPPAWLAGGPHPEVTVEDVEAP